MWLWTRQEAKQIDQLSIRSGMSEESLMETAGQMSAEEIRLRFPKAQSAIVICGPGHNGGDGFVVARELTQKNIKVTVVESSMDHSSSLRLQKKTQFHGPIISIDEFLNQKPNADLWIDGLFGIGLNRNLDEKHISLLFKIQNQTGSKIALDTPSGLNVDTGEIFGACFQANLTLTVGHPKPGFFLNEGPKHCGQIKCLNIGFPAEISHQEARHVYLFSSRIAKRWLPDRRSTDNKTKGGRTLIWAGSSEMPGAAVLASRAALRSGAGYVYCSEKEVLKIAPEAIPWARDDFSKLNSVLIGPGLGTSTSTAKALEALKKTSIPVVMDADALTVAAREKLYPFPKNWIATPHVGELSRFLKSSAREIEANRIESAQVAQKLLGCRVLLKGFHTVMALPRLSLIIPTGNVALAKGGSGDVLGGMIAGFLSQGLTVDRAALLATYVHGKTADDWVQSGRDFLSFAPSDLLKRLPFSLKQLRDLKTAASS